MTELPLATGSKPGEGEGVVVSGRPTSERPLDVGGLCERKCSLAIGPKPERGMLTLTSTLPPTSREVEEESGAPSVSSLGAVLTLGRKPPLTGGPAALRRLLSYLNLEDHCLGRVAFRRRALRCLQRQKRKLKQKK